MVKKYQAAEQRRDQVLNQNTEKTADIIEQAKPKDPTAPSADTGEFLARVQERTEDQDQLYEDKLFAGYIKKYTDLSRQMVIDYKKYAINAYLTEMFCENVTNKGQSKHKDLTERALY